jgi:inhibitor of KinA
MNNVKIYSLGESAVTISFGSEISAETNERVFNLDNYFKAAGFPGFIETVPAYASLTVFFDIKEVRKNFTEFSTASEAVKRIIETALENSYKESEKPVRQIEIPVCFAPESAPDLQYVCETKNLAKKEFIEIFTARIYRVYMLGFLPGFAYMGETDEKIAVPRKENPRAFVPKGSVGIAGRQTGIYPLKSPGGWQIVGRTDLELFTPDAETPTLLQIGNVTPSS